MPEYRRAFIDGGTYFFTVKTHRNRPCLTRADVRYALRQAVRQTRVSFPFHVEAWVILPDHMHCVWRLPEGDSNFSARWSCIKRSVSQTCREYSGLYAPQKDSRQSRGESTLWQRRFWEHLIRDDVDFRQHVDYVHWNPVKHGYVSCVVDWPHSTFHRFVARGIYARDWGGNAVKSCAGEDFGE